jgi:two-component SAPR family response regulator
MILERTIHNKITGFLVLLLIPAYCYTQEIQYGLNFKSYEVVKEKRTSLILTPGEPLSLPDVYTISFDLKIHSSGRYPFGYVFRMFDEEEQNISMLLNTVNNTMKKKLAFTYSSKEILSKTFDEMEMYPDKWHRIDITVDTKEALFTVVVSNKTFSQHIPELKTFDKINLVFGRNDRFGLQITDIPSMAVRDIRIYNDDTKIILYEWRLKNYTEEGSYDEVNHTLATVNNPDWLLSQHVLWKKNASFATERHSMIAYNNEKSEVAIYSKSYFYFFGIPDGIIHIDTMESRYPWSSQSNNLLFDKNSGRYINYTFEFEKEKDVLTYHPETKDWNMAPASIVPPDYWHHNRLISAYDGRLYLFGGYGHHKYKNDVHIYDFASKEWRRDKLKGDIPPPHYLSGLGAWDDKQVLIFGGYGSETGDQALEPRYYYDLYKVNMETLVSEKVWTLEKPENDFIVSNSLVVDTAARSFYALTYSLRQFHTNLTLLKFSADRPEYIMTGDSIPVAFEDNASYVDLFLDRKTEKLVALISGPKDVDSNDNEASIYTISYPPLEKAGLTQRKAPAFIPARVIILTILLVALLLSVWMAYKKIIQKNQGSSEPESGDREDAGKLSEKEKLHEGVNRAAYSREKAEGALHVQSVCLFGGFWVADKNGNDVTKDFTPLLKQLFLLIVLHTYKDGKGISSSKLKDLLWFDKSEESAKNNRGVAISKLRQIFEHVGNISIKSYNSYWTVEMGEDVYCDYSEALYLIDELSKGKELNIDHLKRLLALLSKGELLPSLQVEWVDPFKSDFSNNLMDILFELSKKHEVAGNPQLCIDVADAIFIQDSLNEDALQLKCAALVKMGRNKLSEKVYGAFAKEYKLLFGTDFRTSFEQIVSTELKHQ